MKLTRMLLAALVSGFLFFVTTLPATASNPLGPPGDTQCTDHVDNDNDGTIDYTGLQIPPPPFLIPPDPDCTGPTDDSEAAETVPPTNGTRPGKGCGDRNHVHEREAECKKAAR